MFISKVIIFRIIFPLKFNIFLLLILFLIGLVLGAEILLIGSLLSSVLELEDDSL